MSGGGLVVGREYAIKMHRKMWLWIAEQYRTDSAIAKELWYDVALLKRKFVADFESRNVRVSHNCYCCQYNEEHEHWPGCLCSSCPMKWPSVATDYMCENYQDDDGEGLYGKLCTSCNDLQSLDSTDVSYLMQLSDMCEKIANLPEVL